MTLDEMYANCDLDLINKTAGGKWEMFRDDDGHIKINVFGEKNVGASPGEESAHTANSLNKF